MSATTKNNCRIYDENEETIYLESKVPKTCEKKVGVPHNAKGINLKGGINLTDNKQYTLDCWKYENGLVLFLQVQKKDNSSKSFCLSEDELNGALNCDNESIDKLPNGDSK